MDLVEPSKPYTVADYLSYSRKTVEELSHAGKRVLITGGSGFYLKSFFEPVLDPIEIPEPVAKAVRTLYREQGLAAMVARIKVLNPEGVGDLDIKNPRRVMRALERCLASGKKLPELQAAFRCQAKPFPDYEKRLCLLQRPRESLIQRIEKRTREMLDRGLLAEVRQLKDAGIERNPSAAGSIGYRECLNWMESGGASIPELEEAINMATRRLVKKQASWFRNQIRPDRILNLEEVETEGEADELFDQ
jgi:tRNA dimethylallyltransferase